MCARLTGMGFEIESSDIFSSLSAVRSLLEKDRLRPMLMLEPEAMEVKNLKIVHFTCRS